MTAPVISAFELKARRSLICLATTIFKPLAQSGYEAKKHVGASFAEKGSWVFTSLYKYVDLKPEFQEKCEI